MVVIRYEMIHETRIIPLDGRPHVDAGVRSYMGDARGHWEGNTLVVETTNLIGNTNGIGLNGGGTPHSDALATDRTLYAGIRQHHQLFRRRSTIRKPGPSRGPWHFPCGRTTDSPSMNMRAMKATTACWIS